MSPTVKSGFDGDSNQMKSATAQSSIQRAVSSTARRRTAPAASVLSRKRESGHPLIAIMGEADDGSDRELIKDCGDGRHPGGEGD